MQTAQYLVLALVFSPIVGCATAEALDGSAQAGAASKGGGGGNASTASGVGGTGVAAKGGSTGVTAGLGGSTGASSAAKGGTVGLGSTSSRVPSCTDKIKNGDETDVDCGGTCDTKCAFGKTCATLADCDAAIGVCSQSLKCTTCESGAKDGDETDVDCGGSCTTKCGEGKGCATRADCSTFNCDAGTGLCGIATNCLAVIDAACACEKKVTNTSDAVGCQKVLDCFLANDCGPADACATSNDAVCGANTLGVDGGKYNAAKAVYTCNCS